MTKLLSRPIFHILPRRLQSRNYFWSKSAPATSEAVSHVEPNLTNTPNTLNESMQSLAKEPLQSDSFSSLGNSAVDVSKSSIDASLIQPASDLITKIAQIGDLSSLGFCSAYTPKGWMEMLLEASHVYSGLQWGGSIILGTVILRLVLLPVSIKAQRAIVKMKDFKPLMTVYQEKSKSLKASGKIQDATLINQELFMEMKGKGINPFAGLWGIFQVRNLNGPTRIIFGQHSQNIF